jgi:hypothetical protein
MACERHFASARISASQRVSRPPRVRSALPRLFLQTCFMYEAVHTTFTIRCCMVEQEWFAVFLFLGAILIGAF